jgi:hypothetical protein
VAFRDVNLTKLKLQSERRDRIRLQAASWRMMSREALGTRAWAPEADAARARGKQHEHAETVTSLDGDERGDVRSMATRDGQRRGHAAACCRRKNAATRLMTARVSAQEEGRGCRRACAW